MTVMDRIETKLSFRLLNSLYGVGARNFLLLNVPPIDRCFFFPPVSQEVKDNYKADIATYNRHIQSVAGDLQGEFLPANVWVFDTNSLFNEALDDPMRFEQTKDIKNTDSFCPAYAFGTPTTHYENPVCDFPVNEYFWLNGLHPTFMIHDALAEKVAGMLGRGPNAC